MTKKIILSLVMLGVLASTALPANAQYHRHRRCWWRHHHRVCRMR